MLHYLPNAVLGLLSSLVVEISLGSLNMLLVAVVSYGWTVWHGFCEDALSREKSCGEKGWGFSSTLYQYFTVVGGALFIRYWCFNKVKDFTLSDRVCATNICFSVARITHQACFGGVQGCK